MLTKFYPLPLHLKTMLLAFALVVSTSFLGAFLLIESVQRSLQIELGERVLAIAKTVAQTDELRVHIVEENGWQQIQPLAERIRQATNIEYIIVLDMDRRRLSSPVEDRIGTIFSGGDESPAFAEHEYISRAHGVLGPSVRAFVPVMNESEQIGVVVAGVLSPTYPELVREFRIDLYLSLISALLLGLLGSWLLARNIKTQLFNLEPLEIARLLQERSSVFHSIKEGIVTIDSSGIITLANNQALSIFALVKPVNNYSIKDILPESPVFAVMEHEQQVVNKSMLINNNVFLVSFFPLTVNDQVLGAVITLQGQSDAYLLAEELTGVKKFIEALRVQNHEHMNKLHTIAGLLQLQKHDQALEYVFAVTEKQLALTTFLTKNFTDYSISGLLLGKFNRCKELGIDLLIDPDSRLHSRPVNMESGALVVIIGNLIENAMDAVQAKQSKKRTVFVSITVDNNELKIIVKDNGTGIDTEIQKHIYEQGFTSKGSANRGIGLALIKEHIESANGTISYQTADNLGTTFYVNIPMTTS